MKVLLINGSRREKGCTYTALSLVAGALNEDGIETEILFVGKETMNGNIDSIVRTAAEKMKECDGLVVGSPVYYAGPSGEITAFLDRLFSSALGVLRLKPAAAVSSARRAGTTATLDALNKYFTFAEMPIVSSRYWNEVHGATPEDVLADKEGVQIMEVLGHNMAWLLRSIAAGKEAGIVSPDPVVKVFTSFIRK